MANIKSAIKRAKKDEQLRAQNASARSAFRTSVKKVLKSIAAGDAESANSAYHQAQSIIDKTAYKGLIHKNKAARIKTRLVARLKKLAQSN